MEIKRSKCREEEEEGAISKLPEELVCHILSFLSTKEAALTSVLSKRWRNLYTWTPSLDLDDTLFVPGDRPEEYEPTSFVEFVNRVLSLEPNSPITKFSLVCHKGVDQCVVSDWIAKALRRGATDLTFMLLFPPRRGYYSLPLSIYMDCQNLVKLKLGRGEVGILGEYLSREDFTFAKLTTLHLDLHSNKLGPDNGSRFVLLLSKCPVLEKLIVNYMKWQLWKSVGSVSSPTLRRLTVDNEIYHSNLPWSINSDIRLLYSSNNPRHVSFDTPNLLYFNYSDFVACSYPLVRLDSLVEARLDVGLTNVQKSSRDKDTHKVHWNATNFIMGIHNVHTLELTCDTLEVIADFCNTIPVFHNLNHLAIESNAEQGWQALPLLLPNCPNLHTLVFHGLHHAVSDGCGDVCDCISPASDTSCLPLCPVKVLKITDFGATCAEMSLVQHLLNKMPQLEQVVIELNFDSVHEEELDLFVVSSALEMAPRASPNCNLKVVNY